MQNLLVTGGAGFLGRAILSQAERRWPGVSVTVYGRDPMKLQVVQARYGCATVIGDVLDYHRLCVVMDECDTVIHAAAMKHVPLGEDNPSECYRVNVEGSRNVILAAIACGVKHLVLISTDKACEPANAYGLSKAMMERIGVEYAGRQTDTAIHIVRYGNVVGSTGSVIPLFQQQVAEGKTLTVTDPAMTRFWLSPSMALDAIERAMEGPSGTIYVPKVGAMRMGDLVRFFSPMTFAKVIGHRPGEKFHETLMTVGESTRAVHMADGFRIYPFGVAVDGSYAQAFTSDDDWPGVDPADMAEWIAEGAEL